MSSPKSGNGRRKKPVPAPRVIEDHQNSALTGNTVEKPLPRKAASQSEIPAKPALDGPALENVFKLVFENSLGGFAFHEIICDAQGKPIDYRFLSINPAFEKLTGLQAADVVGKTVLEVMPATERSWIEKYGRVALTGESIQFENFSAALDRYYEVRAFSPERGKFGVVFQDVTLRVLAEQDLRESEAEFRALFDQAAVGVAHYSKEQGRFLRVNRKFCEISGYSREELLKKGFRDITHPDDLARDTALVGQLLSGEKRSFTVEKRYVQPDGNVVWARLDCSALCEPGEKPSSIMAVIADISAQKKAEDALRESEDRFRKMVTASPLGIAVAQNGRQVMVNEAYARMFRLFDPSEAVGISFLEHIAPECRGEVKQWNQKREAGIDTPLMYETVGYRRDQTRFPMRVSATKIALSNGPATLALLEDVSAQKQSEEEKKALEAKMQQAQKLESLGVLAGGIAHDFNNLLMVILGSLELARVKGGSDSPVTKHLQAAEIASMRAAELCRQMLAYSGKGHFRFEVLDLNAVIEEMVSMLLVTVSKKVTLVRNLQAGLPPMKGDPSQIRQIIMNLIINASEAMGEGVGEVNLRTGVRRCERAYFAGTWLQEDLPEGEYLFMEVADNGSGMVPETLGKIFDPFFSTKFTGRGLGLAAVLGIIRQHHGAIRVVSEKARGTTFTVVFPVSNHFVNRPESSAVRPLEMPGGRILLVDDDFALREVGAEILGILGFDVMTAADGVDAVAVFDREMKSPDPKTRFSCVILDLTMPRMSGDEAYRILRGLSPGIPIIIASGFSEMEIRPRFEGMGNVGFLQKPYDIEKLRALLAELMSRK